MVKKKERIHLAVDNNQELIRIDKFLSPENSPQVAKSLSAIIEGGFFGVGLGEGQLKYSIPESHNDFIFAILIEEFGIFFGLFIFFSIKFRVFFVLFDEDKST